MTPKAASEALVTPEVSGYAFVVLSADSPAYLTGQRSADAGGYGRWNRCG
jgi:hypothetical protein